jgi:hypothetical protein
MGPQYIINGSINSLDFLSDGGLSINGIGGGGEPDRRCHCRRRGALTACKAIGGGMAAATLPPNLLVLSSLFLPKSPRITSLGIYICIDNYFVRAAKRKLAYDR